MDAEEQIVNEASDGSIHTINLSDEDDSLEIANPNQAEEANGRQGEHGLVQHQDEIVNLEGNEVQRDIDDDDDLIIEELPRPDSNEMQDARSTKLVELLSWFKRLKPEHFTEFKTAGDNYLSEYVGEESFLPMDQCVNIASDYKESGSLTGLAEKWKLENDELLMAAICIGISDSNNSFDIDFGVLGDDRIDEWSIEKGELFIQKAAKGRNTPVNPLKFMQFTMTSPASAMILLTYFQMRINNFPCQFALEDGPGERIGDIDIRELGTKIVESSAKYWREQKEAIQQSAHANMTKELNDYFHEIEATSSEMKDHFETTLGQRSEVVKLLRNKVPQVEIPEVFNQELLSEAAREELARAEATMELLRAETEKFSAEARQAYDGKMSIEKMHALKPGDFCLARTINLDSSDLKYAIVDKVLSAEKYRVKFMTSNKLAEVHIRDMALTNHGLCSPVYGVTGHVGLRVAVYFPRKTNQFHQKWQWETGTIGARRTANNGEFLVFFDDGSDAYASAPAAPGDTGYEQVISKPIGAPVSFQDILTRMKAARIAVMVGQPIGSSGALEKRYSHGWVRDKNRSDYIKHYMSVYPEFWLLKMPIGMTTSLLGVPPDRSRQRVTVVGQNKSFAIVRPMRDSMRVGYNCLDYPCKNHVHDDDLSIYRGSARFVDGSLKVRESMLANSNNNLSRRKKGQIASGFELAESSKVMPQKVDSHQMVNMRLPVAAVRSAPEDKRKTQAEIEQKKRRQTLFRKTVNHVPVMPPNGGIGPHSHCGPDCLLKMDASPYDSRFHKNSPLHTPILCGWRRLKYTMQNGKRRSPFKKLIVYIAPCGKPLEKLEEISEYLRDTRSQLAIDCFTFAPGVDTETYIVVDDKYVRMPDLSQGIEGIPIPLVNTVDDDPNPVLEYCKRRFPYNQTVDISSISQDFCSGCSCEGDCSQNENCECQMLSKQSLERLPKYLQYDNNKKQAAMYANRLLPNKVPTGVYECNDKCKCKRDLCHNRVVQNNIKYPVQIFKTAQSGWGCRALTDIPDGAFICTYVGALLTNDLAEELQNDDQYFADLDLKDGVEMLKVREDHDTDMGYGGEESNDEEFSDAGLDDDEDDANDKNVIHRTEASSLQRPKRVTRRASQEEKVEDASLGGGGDEKLEKEKKDEPVFNWDDYFDKSALFVVDAKIRGNIGRFLNHSCAPNCIVQHVMYDTHDLRLPWVAFFTAHTVKAGDELTWDYQYAVNPGQTRIQCHCGSEVCRNRLL